MPDTMNLNVRISGSLKDFVSREISAGAYENMSEYVRDLIRRDKERQEDAKLHALKAELQHAFATPENECVEISEKEFFARKDTQHR